jgi:hypothetical protein
MHHLKFVTLVASLCAGAALAGCGGGSSTTSSTPAASPTATSVTFGEQRALPLAVAAVVPSGLKCNKEDIVWANMHTKAYHDPGDPYYGKTRNGAYMCRDTANAQGYHPAGQRHKGMNNGNGMTGATPGAGATPEATATPFHRHRHRNPAQGAATPSPT